MPERDLTAREEEKFLEIALTFLRRHTEDSMTIEGLELYHQKLMKVDAADANSCRGAATTEVSSSKQLARFSTSSGETTKKALKNDGSKCQVWAMEVTLILKVSFAFLPNNLLGNMAAVAFEEHEQEFLDLLHEQQAFYTFFKIMDGVSAFGVQDLTIPPTESPTTLAYYLAKQEVPILANETSPEETEAGLGFGVFVGVGIGFLWCCLTAISIAYLMNARGEMEEQRDLENLLNAEKADPVAAAAGGDKDDDLKKNSDANISSSDSDPFDQSKNPRLNARARAGLSQSVNVTGVQRVETAVAARRVHSTEDMKRVQFSSTQRPMAQSVVVTKNENRAVLEKDKTAIPSATSEPVTGSQQQQQVGLTLADHGGNMPIKGKPGRRSQSVVITKHESKELLNQSAPDLRKSSTKKRLSSGSRKFSQSMNLETLEESLAKNDDKALKRSGRSSMRASSGDLRRSSTRSNSKDSLNRRSSSSNSSSENLRSSSKDAPKRSSNANRDDGKLRHSDKGGSSSNRKSSSQAKRSQSMIV